MKATILFGACICFCFMTHSAKEVIRDAKANGKVSYEVEVKKKTLLFDRQGSFKKAEEGEND